jgi:hypothetical protein
MPFPCSWNEDAGTIGETCQHPTYIWFFYITYISSFIIWPPSDQCLNTAIYSFHSGSTNSWNDALLLCSEKEEKKNGKTFATVARHSGFDWHSEQVILSQLE